MTTDQISAPTGWTSTCLGLAGEHVDPCLAGPPLASPDGHWWWDGGQWCIRHLDAATV